MEKNKVTSKYTFEFKEQLKDTIEKNTSYLEKIQISRIIINSKDKYTDNKNGLFINLFNCSDELIEDINEYLKFSKDNKEKIKIIEQEKEELKKKHQQNI